MLTTLLVIIPYLTSSFNKVAYFVACITSLYKYFLMFGIRSVTDKLAWPKFTGRIMFVEKISGCMQLDWFVIIYAQIHICCKNSSLFPVHFDGNVLQGLTTRNRYLQFQLSDNYDLRKLFTLYRWINFKYFCMHESPIERKSQNDNRRKPFLATFNLWALKNFNLNWLKIRLHSMFEKPFDWFNYSRNDGLFCRVPKLLLRRYRYRFQESFDRGEKKLITNINIPFDTLFERIIY